MHNMVKLVPFLALYSFGTVFGQTVAARSPFIRAVGEGTGSKKAGVMKSVTVTPLAV